MQRRAFCKSAVAAGIGSISLSTTARSDIPAVTGDGQETLLSGPELQALEKRLSGRLLLASCPVPA